MGLEEDLQKAIISRKMRICPACNGFMRATLSGLHYCVRCGYEEYDDFGKVIDFLREVGPCPAYAITQNTGVSIDVVNQMIEEGAIEFVDSGAGRDSKVSVTSKRGSAEGKLRFLGK